LPKIEAKIANGLPEDPSSAAAAASSDDTQKKDDSKGDGKDEGKGG
jgi:hypothetical protein